MFPPTTYLLYSFYLLLLFYILLLLPESFSHSEWADGLSLEFEWQQISSSFQVSSQYSGRSQRCCSLDGLHASSYFQVLQSMSQSFGDCTKSTNYNWYNRYYHVPRFFQFPSKVQVLILLFAFFQFYSVDSNVHNSVKSFLLLLIIIRFSRD